MGECLKSIARRGAVGKTARWAAHLYRRWTRLTPEDPVAMDSVLFTLIATRYDVDALVWPGSRSQRIRTALGTLHDAGRIHSICHVVVLILAAEVDFVEHSTEVKTVFVEVIGAELASAGVPPEHAFGQDLHLCPEGRYAAYRPSMELLGLLLQV